MWKSIKKWWKYLGAKLGSSFDEKADPKVQLEQAITEAQEQHRRLMEQAANVIANQKQTEIRLNTGLDELEKLNRNAQQAVIMADEAVRSGDTAKAEEFTSAAEAFANQLISKEAEIENLKTLSLQSTQASDQAKAAVQQNARLLQEKLAEKQKLLSQLDQAKMAEQMNTAMASLNQTVGGDVPTLSEVRDKIETRYAKAKGMAEVQGMSVESKMLEVEQATVNVAAQARLSEIRSKLGIGDQQATPGAADTAPADGQPAGEQATAEGESPTTLPRRRLTRQHHQVVAVHDLALALGQLRGPTAGHRAQRRRTHTCEALGDDPPVGVAQLDRVLGGEAPAHLEHAGGQQRAAALGHGPHRAVVEHDLALGRQGERDPQLASGQAPLTWLHAGAHAGTTGDDVGQHVGT